MVEMFYLGPQIFKGSVIGDNVIGPAEPLLSAWLGLYNRLDLLDAIVVTRRDTADLQCFRYIDDQHFVDHG